MKGVILPPKKKKKWRVLLIDYIKEVLIFVLEDRISTLV